MEEQQELDKIWTGVYSSSISNFHEKLDKRLGIERKWRMFSPVIFIGLYHWGDYIKYLFHFGEKKVFWCGSDILNLSKNTGWSLLLPMKIATHYCENGVEKYELYRNGIWNAMMIPMIFDDPEKYQICFEPSDTPKVFMTTHIGRHTEYGVEMAIRAAQKAGVTLDYFHSTPEDEFNEKIKGYQASIRLNNFDGFAESTAKSILLGQYPITLIKYPNLDSFLNEEQLVILLKDLKNKRVPNPYSEQWRRRLEQSLQELLS